MSSLKLIGERVWCPFCEDYEQLLRVSKTAKLADVSTRTIYRYIEEGIVYAIKVAGKTYRVCSGCLLRQDLDSRREKYSSDKK